MSYGGQCFRTLALSHEQLYDESDFRLAVPQFPRLGLLLVVDGWC